MWGLISIISALVINFYTPKIPDSKNSINNNLWTRSFPFQYFEGEVLTDDQVKYRFGIIYINSLMFTTVTVSSFPALGPIMQIGLPIPLVSVERLMERNNFYFQNEKMKKSLPIIKDIVDQLELTGPQAEKLEIVAEQFVLGKIKREDAILKLRGGDGMGDIAVILGFLYLINWLDPGYGFQNVPMPHMDPFGWINGNYDNKSMPPISYKSSQFELEMAGISDEMCPGSEMADENGFVMSYDEAYNLVAETYPGYMQVDENCKITDWQAVKHIYHANGMGVDLSKYGFTQKQLNKIRGESRYKGIGLIAYARRG